jgi:hypothetical protein
MRRVLITAATTVAAALLAAGMGAAGSASAAPVGTTGPGSWQFDQGDGNNAIQTTTSPPTVSYSATVQQPINAPGQIPSVFSNKTRTIPVKYTVNKCTTPGASKTVYPDTLESDLGATYPSIGDYGALEFFPPAGTTVSSLSGLTASYAWATGTDHGGSMRWSVHVPGLSGSIFVYYGDEPNFASESVSQSGVNMIANTSDVRVDTSQLPGGTFYDTWAHALTLAGSQPVSSVSLVVDAGWGGTQKVQLTDVQVNETTGLSEYVPGTVTSGGGSPVCAPDTTDNFWLYLSKKSGAAPAQQIDESLIDNTQGDFGGQFRMTGGFYMYNLPLSQLTDLTATYQIGISPNSDGSNPAGLVTFGLK